MPTFEVLARFWADLDSLSVEQKLRFLQARDEFVEDLTAGRQPRQSLRVKRFRRAGGWELSWAPNGRALFEHGPERRPGEPHIIWRRVGTHDIFENP